MTRTANAAKNVASHICRILKVKPTNSQWEEIVSEITLAIMGEDTFSARIKPHHKTQEKGAGSENQQNKGA